MSIETLRKLVATELQNRVDELTNSALDIRAPTCEAIALNVTALLSEARGYGKALNILNETFRKLTEPPKTEENNLTAKQEKRSFYG